MKKYSLLRWKDFRINEIQKSKLEEQVNVVREITSGFSEYIAGDEKEKKQALKNLEKISWRFSVKVSEQEYKSLFSTIFKELNKLM